MGMVKLKVPESLREEHEAFIDGLKSRSKSKGETGVALRRLLKLLEPHVEKEDELVLPLLGALQGMADGLPFENPSPVMRSYEKYAGQYANMFAEHLPIRQALKRAKTAARREGHEDIVEILDALAHHSRVEEEVLYPAALLIGKAALQPPSATPGDTESTGGLSYFALDYDAPMSVVRRTLMMRHHDIEEMLSEVEDLVQKGKQRVAVSLLNVATPLVLRSAVEEEARVMRVVMQKNKNRNQRSVAITREHRDIVDFLKHQLPALAKSPEEAGPKIMEFVKVMRKHLAEEEDVEFPLAASEQ
jgi:iron-sulfur cluster repair protein YtfE (RIC family)